MLDELYSLDFYKMLSKDEQINQLQADLEYWHEEAVTLRKLYESARERNAKLVNELNKVAKGVNDVYKQRYIGNSTEV